MRGARERRTRGAHTRTIPALLAEAPGCPLIPPTAAALTQALTRIAMDHARLFQRITPTR